MKAKNNLSSFASQLGEQMFRLNYARNAHVMQPGDLKWAYYERSERAKLVNMLDEPRKYTRV